MAFPCFVITQTHEAERSLRRLCLGEDNLCPLEGQKFHKAVVGIGRAPVVLTEHHSFAQIEADEYQGDERWPTHCACGYAFAEDDYWLVDQEAVYVAEDGREMTLVEAPVGAIWVAAWMTQEHFGVNGGTGPVYVVRLPGNHDWMPGQNASNCDRKGEDHDCWCVHGEAPNLTVDKTPEPGRSTCTAGAGSIWVAQGTPSEWHGFLRGGRLLEVGES
jgi:hypothetical protein